MKQTINIHIGQAGSQIGNACWEYFTQQHGITQQGSLTQQAKSSADESSNLLFYETQKGKYVPRSIFVDLEPTVLDQIRTGSYRNLFNSSCLISGKEDAASNHIRGHYTIGKQKIDQTLDIIRKNAQKCSNIDSFFIYNSICGGTGSGFGSLLEERLSVQYGKKAKIGFKVFPSNKFSSEVVEPYNSVLTTHSILEHNDMTIGFNNEALYDICSRKLDIENPNYSDINRLIAKVASQMLLPMRFRGSLNTDTKQIQTNLIPYPRIHFIMPSYSPFSETDKKYQERISVEDLTLSVFNRSNQMIKCNPQHGKYMASCLLYNGDVTPKQVINSMSALRNSRTVNFVDWCPTGLKVSVGGRPSFKVKQKNLGNYQRSCCMLSNNSSISEIMDKMSLNFDKMYAKRAFVHWYVGEGLDEGFFPEARQDLAALYKDYEEVVIETDNEDIYG